MDERERSRSVSREGEMEEKECENGERSGQIASEEKVDNVERSQRSGDSSSKHARGGHVFTD